MWVAVLFGAIGGLLRHVAQNRAVLWPRIRRAVGKRPALDLGLFEEILLGAGAGLVLVEGASGASVPPIAVAVVGGFAGASVLRRKAIELFGDEVRYNNTKEVATDVVDVDMFLQEVGYTFEELEKMLKELKQHTALVKGDTDGHSDGDK